MTSKYTKTELKAYFSKALKSQMEKIDMTAGRLERSSGVGRSCIGHYLDQTTYPLDETKNKLSEALGVSKSELFLDAEGLNYDKDNHTSNDIITEEFTAEELKDFFSKNLKAELVKQRLTAGAFQKRSGIGRDSVGRYLKKLSYPEDITKRKLCRNLGVPASQLFLDANGLSFQNAGYDNGDKIFIRLSKEVSARTAEQIMTLIVADEVVHGK